MKQCPTCGTTYTDATLRFCLADGSPLNDLAGEAPTVVRSNSGEKTVAMGGGQMRVDIPQETAPPVYQNAQKSARGSSGGALKVILVILGLGLLIVVIALIGTLIYYNTRPGTVAKANTDLKTPAASPAPTNDDKDDLRDQIANLQRQIADQKNKPANSVTVPNLSKTTMTTTARANSPADGFLALRSLPSAQIGERILKIPHGATVSVGGCGPVEASVHPGRWCQARYNGYEGYVYDYYLIY